MRPKWCVLAGTSGTHTICVCPTHQNVKLMVDALHIKDNYKELMAKLVCSTAGVSIFSNKGPHSNYISHIIWTDNLLQNSYYDKVFRYNYICLEIIYTSVEY